MKEVTLFFNIIPKPIQSIRGGRGHYYQPKENVKYKDDIKVQAYNQLPDDWTPFNKAIEIVELRYLFPIPASMPKIYKENILIDHNRVYRNKRPDLGDNLFKGLADALTGIIWEDDSLIVKINNVYKVYAEQPGIFIQIQELDGLSW
jgi:Holliday junction resolvase RusA-like endonuclease